MTVRPGAAPRMPRQRAQAASSPVQFLFGRFFSHVHFPLCECAALAHAHNSVGLTISLDGLPLVWEDVCPVGIVRDPTWMNEQLLSRISVVANDGCSFSSPHLFPCRNYTAGVWHFTLTSSSCVAG
jgi:hypothetical protein